MIKYYLSLLLLLSAQLHAQKKNDYLELANYKHTIVYDDHKVVFQAQATDVILKSTDPKKNYFWFANNQINSTQGGYSGKLLHGLYTDFYANKNLKEQGYYNKGLKEGPWKSWNDQGILLSQINYKNGIADGNYYLYDNMGNLTEAGRHKDGKIDGIQKKYMGEDITKTRYRAGIAKPKNKNWIKNLFAKRSVAALK